ncbi:hypothetical protein LV457_10840 [Mycobacterium sp. MYCO198283]|uniref:hypothetical protein n=1 Tax=Mycobacterium sp. MYCO198283 TaxID=2883505 RepID=UPI001E2B9ED4|nr:hypothetical protein [Mycobacterium sp. MYCO198283]MCG5432783.1 hypothetical protein [Mycobacterium sp. MYCO198283]
MTQPPFDWTLSPALAKPRRSWLPVALSALAVVLATAALIAALTQSPTRGTSESAASAAPVVPDQVTYSDAQDRELCEAIAPIMENAARHSREFASLKRGSPEQAAALPGYRDFVLGWVGEVQPLLNEHEQPPRFLTRTLQRYLDDVVLFVQLDIVSSDVGVTTWQQSVSDYGGPFYTCMKLGVTW